MECCEPGAIRDEELIAYLEGEQVRPAVLEHLARCQTCSSQLAAYRQLDLKLVKKLYRWDCPPNQVLGEYQLGLLGTAYMAEIKAHLHRCVLCSAEIAVLSEFLASDALLMEPVTVAPQAEPFSLNNHHAVQEKKPLLDQLLERGQLATQRIIATLLPPAPGLASQRDVRQQTTQWPRRYSADDVSISLQVERGLQPGLQLIGFVTRQGVALHALQGVGVQLAAGAGTVYTQTIDELGNFVFSSLVPATYTLELQFPQGTIVIDQLAIAPQE